MSHADVVLSRLAHEPAVWVTVLSTQGSVPRDAGTWMAVFAGDCVGTIGGGHVEYQAIAHARKGLAGQAAAEQRRFALGPSLGQCCGGVMVLQFEPVTAASQDMLRQRMRAALMPVALFGGGHVGQALVQVLARLPFAVRWIDSRDEVFPAALPETVQTEYSDPVQAAVADLAAHSRVLIMSFSHAEDLDIVAACLQRVRARGDLPYVGLIGSRTKWATFRHRLQERGFADDELARITCPIGIAGVPGKEPEVIAIAVAAQLLQLRDAGV
ncbi:MAG: xanthine dehydrogenase accessory protein XdhC [Burkholderiaceae bacterium]